MMVLLQKPAQKIILRRKALSKIEDRLMDDIVSFDRLLRFGLISPLKLLSSDEVRLIVDALRINDREKERLKFAPYLMPVHVLETGDKKNLFRKWSVDRRELESKLREMMDYLHWFALLDMADQLWLHQTDKKKWQGTIVQFDKY